ncbi:MAG: hypothetical protein RR314_03890 [Oscillospiraceae bacterium]
MERLTKKLPEGGYDANGHGDGELLAALGKLEDLYESVVAEHELIRLNMRDLSKLGKASTATYTMLMGSRYLLEELQKRMDETPADTEGRLAQLKKLIANPDAPADDGYKDVE